MCLLKKGIIYKNKLVFASNVPEWLENASNGRLPCLCHEGNIISDSLAIAEYIESRYHEPKLFVTDSSCSTKDVIIKAKDFYSSFEKCMKTTGGFDKDSA